MKIKPNKPKPKQTKNNKPKETPQKNKKPTLKQKAKKPNQTKTTRKKSLHFQFSELSYEMLTLCFTLPSLLCAEVIAGFIFTVLLKVSFRIQTSG